MTEKTERNKASSEVVRQSDLALLTDVQAALQQEKHHALFLMVIFLLVLVVTFVIWAWNSDPWSGEYYSRQQGAGYTDP